MRARVGPYELLDLLGQGGMGTVHRARHVELGAVRALKLLRPRAGADRAQAAARFAREVRALASVRHPNVVRLHEAGVRPEDGAPWFAMDLVEGEPLDRVLARGPLPLDRALELVIGVCRGVEALHAAGVVHRDLKPQNVIVAADGRPVVIDLGLALDPDEAERLTRTGALVGTPHYMAPEQLSGRGVSPRTDVHALGLLLYEVVTGEPALGADSSSVQQVIGAVLGRARPTPSTRDPTLPDDLDAVCRRAAALDPADRHADAGGLAAALEVLRARPGPQPPRPSAPPRGPLGGGGRRRPPGARRVRARSAGVAHGDPTAAARDRAGAARPGVRPVARGGRARGAGRPRRPAPRQGRAPGRGRAPVPDPLADASRRRGRARGAPRRAAGPPAPRGRPRLGAGPVRRPGRAPRSSRRRAPRRACGRPPTATPGRTPVRCRASTTRRAPWHAAPDRGALVAALRGGRLVLLEGSSRARRRGRSPRFRSWPPWRWPTTGRSPPPRPGRVTAGSPCTCSRPAPPPGSSAGSAPTLARSPSRGRGSSSRAAGAPSAPPTRAGSRTRSWPGTPPRARSAGGSTACPR
ncbi:MAG: serine/threonine protein kinase [Planctomycetes bacterium]|nr:serine/threonine protein kinase [Planctomycetota bacterium]